MSSHLIVFQYSILVLFLYRIFKCVFILICVEYHRVIYLHSIVVITFLVIDWVYQWLL